MTVKNGAWFGVALAMLFCVFSARSGDWPQWRYDSYRSADSPEELPSDLELIWVREYSPRLQVWDDPLNHDLMSYDRVFEPVVMGDLMFVGFNDRDRVVALDIHTGREVWTFYAGGPVRLPPVAGAGKVYFVSDDGYLYCVRARDGTQVWKFRGGPSERKALGNERVISAWPARGGPVLRDGSLYFAASIWPFMGTFIYAVEAETGVIEWVNDGTGAQFMKQPHSTLAFAGVAPQGPLVATRHYVLIPGGRSVPAAFDRQDGSFRYYNLDDGGKGNGGSFVAANESEFFVHTRLRGVRSFELKNGKKGTNVLNEPVLTGDFLYSGQEHPQLRMKVVDAEEKLLAARQAEADARAELFRTQTEADKEGYKKATTNLASTTRKTAEAERRLKRARENLGTNYSGPVIQALSTKDKRVKWELPVDATFELIKAGRRLYGAGTNGLLAVDLPTGTETPRLSWSNAVSGRVPRLLAANGKLFAITAEGHILAFGSATGKPPARLADQPVAGKLSKQILSRAKALIEAADARQGYALWFGVDDGNLLEAVIRQSELNITAVEADADKVEPLRRRFDAAGLYGTRVAVHAGDPLSFSAPPYIANLVVIGDEEAARFATPGLLPVIYESVRPYGGVLWIGAGASKPESLARRVQSAALTKARVSVRSKAVAVVREGALPGSAQWTHQYGNIGNTVKSDDKLVRLPLGVLWFGGNTHNDVLPRHGHGPSEQIAGGRLFIEGITNLSARDVYTGRVLWKREFDDLGNFGVYLDASYTNTPLSTTYNQKHIPGANARGANYVVTEAEVFLVAGSSCRVLDARNGHTLRTIELPKGPGEESPPEWGFLGLYEDLLLAGAGFAHYQQRLKLAVTNGPPVIEDKSASQGLVVMNRRTGKPVWSTKARYSFPHNGIVAGNGRIYCLDKLPKSTEDRLKRRGRTRPKDYRILAFDARDGRQLWEVSTNVFGTWLSYSREHDILLQAGANATDRLKDEAEKGMATYRGRDGSLVWQKLELKYGGPCILHHDTILTTPSSYKTNAGAFSLLDGKQRLLNNPLTHQPEPWRIFRTYGCNYPIACESMVTFRSGAAGFYDLETHSGTGNFGGFKSGCSPNLIAAEGVLNAPDYTRTCSCPYQNQTSLAFVHMPELEVWAHNLYGSELKEGVRIQRLGINFGAPGDRMADNGTLWMDFPSVGGNSHPLSLSIYGGRTNCFRRHASQLRGEGPAWIVASGIYDLEEIRLTPVTWLPKSTNAAPAAKKAEEKAKDDDDDDDDKDSDKTESGTDNGTNSVSTTNGSAKNGAGLTNQVSVSTTATHLVAKAPALAPAIYTVRLYFSEPDPLSPGDRVFDVQLQNEPVLSNFDIKAAAGGSLRGIVREFQNILVTDQLVVRFNRSTGSKAGPLICGLELVFESEAPQLTDPLLPAGK